MSDERKKKPSGGRPLARRLFSTSNVQSTSSNPQSSKIQTTHSLPVADDDRQFSRPSFFGQDSSRSASTPQLVESPISEHNAFIRSQAQSPARPTPADSNSSLASASPSPRPKATKKPTLLSFASSGADTRNAPSEEADIPRSPSLHRWDTLRRHVMNEERGSIDEPPLTPPLPALVPNRPATPTRATTPSGKQFRLPKRFRQVVEQVQEVSGDNARLFADQVLRAVIIARTGEQRPSKRHEREGTAHFNRTFMSTNITLPGSANISTSNLTQGRSAHRGASTPVPSAQSGPSIGPLHSLLTQYVDVQVDATLPRQVLPYETDVLSVLLAPFLNPIVNPSVEAARNQSLEAYEAVVMIWPSNSNVAELQRCFWCCKAAQPASVPKMLRLRILGALSSGLFAPGASFRSNAPTILQTLLQALFSLFASLSALPSAREEVEYVRELIVNILHGACGDLEPERVLQELGVPMARPDDVYVKDCLVIQALSACLELDAPANRPHIIEALSEDFWRLSTGTLPPPPDLSPLFSRALARCSRAILDYLPAAERAAEYDKRSQVLRLFRNRLVQRSERLPDSEAAEPRALIARIVFKMLCMDDTPEQEEAKLLLAQSFSLSKSPWTAAFESALRQMTEEESWPSLIAVFTALIEQLSDDFRVPVTAAFLPVFNERLANDPPRGPSPALTELLSSIAHNHPKLFYKPLFSLAGASKDVTIVSNLRIVVQLAHFLPSFWTSDVEMMMVALMSDNTPGPVRRSRPGVLVLMLELSTYVRSLATSLRKDKLSEEAIAVQAQFFYALENRLGAVLSITDVKSPLPNSHRILLTSLFLEIRLLIRSLKLAQWLPRVLAWVVDVDHIDEQDSDTETAATKLASIYASAQSKRAGVTNFRFNPPPLVPSASQVLRTLPEDQGGGSPYDHLNDRVHSLSILRNGIASNALALLVACSGMLSSDDYRRLSGPLWGSCLDRAAPHIQVRSAFLLMQAAERPETHLIELIRGDLTSPHATVRRQAVKRISLLAAWRLQLLSQVYITDKNYRRPFKLTRTPLSFIATDMGASAWVAEDDPEAMKASNGTVIPLELRKRLADIGWSLDVEAVDYHAGLIKTPLSLLPSHQLERLGASSADGSQSLSRPSSPSPDSALSTARQAPVKRRPIFVPTLATILSELAYLLFDDDFTVVSATRSALLDYMREDPALVTRPVLDLFTGNGDKVSEGVAILQAFTHMQRILPPAMSHHVFNHITGYLKTTAKRLDGSLSAFALSLPVLASYATHVSSLSVRDIRRAKVEPFLIPSGALWFPPSAPTGPMFPRSLGDAMQERRASTQDCLVQITMVRVAQNMLFLNMLKRHPQDVAMIRKSMTRLVLPSHNEGFDFVAADMHAYIPRKPGTITKSNVSKELAGMSLVLSRSYLLLIEAIFKSMPRHLNDRAELAILVDGLNRILLAHGDDIGIVAHILIALMIASTRFRRIFSSSGGYTLFMPAVVKVYAEMEDNLGIRAAIEYAVNRFYALYQESFVFQSLDILSHIMTFPHVDCEWMAKHIYSLFHSLRDSSPLTAPDHAGILGANRAEEQEALLIYTAEEKPQTLFSILKREKSARGTENISLELPEQYENGKLSSDNMIRLFLTVIGHDPSIRRAEHFLHLMRYIAPHFYSDRRSHQVLKGGIEALSTIFISRSASTSRKVPDSAQLRSQDDSSFTVYSRTGADFFGEARSPSDLVRMRLDYLSLVAAFAKAGGHLDSNSAAAARVMDLVKIAMKDGESDPTVVGRISSFLADYARHSLIRTVPLKLKHILSFLRDLLPIYKAYTVILDFAGVLGVLLELSRQPVYAREPAFAQTVVGQFCVIALNAHELASSTPHVSLSFRPILVKLLCHAILMAGPNVISILEKRSATYEFVAEILVPFALELPSSSQVAHSTEWPRGAPAHTMARLLLMIMSQCEGTAQLGVPPRPVQLERSNSKDKRTSSIRKDQSAMLLPMYIQLIKIIVLRAENDLSSTLPGIWVQLGQFLKRMFAGGSAEFALHALDGESEMSRPPTPSSPRPDAIVEDSSDPFAPPSRSNSLSTHGFARPRIVDYIFWSTLEFACLHRSPLLVQLRLPMQTAAARLDLGLRSNTAPSPRTRRLSVFAKPRRLSGRVSGGTTPETSPFLRASDSLSRPGSMQGFGLGSTTSGFSTPQRGTPVKEERQPGYARFATPMSSPSQAPAAGPRIVHLGPVPSSPSAGGGLFRRGSGLSGSGHGGLPAHIMATRMARVHSATLVWATYRRVRAVQQVMGYTLLLPLVEGEGEDAVGDVQTWTRKHTLEAVKKETEELREGLADSAWEDEGVLADTDTSFTSLES